jgi:hypothetical protein
VRLSRPWGQVAPLDAHSYAGHVGVGLEIGFERRKKVWVLFLVNGELVIFAGLLAGDLYDQRRFVRHRDAPYTCRKHIAAEGRM